MNALQSHKPTRAKSNISGPKVDIMLPYWGEFSLLKQAVDSVLAQTETSWRLVIIDDAYPSLEAQTYFKKLADKRITYIRHKTNIGITKNFNFSVDEASATFCVIFGCDDILLPNYLETALRKIGDTSFYQPGVEVIDGTGQVYLPMTDRVKKLLRPKKSGIYKGAKIAATLGTGNWLYFPSILWRTSELKARRFDEHNDNTQDVIMELSIVRDGGEIYVDDTVTFQYRRFADSFSSKRRSGSGARFDEESRIYQKFSKEFSKLGWKKASLLARLHLSSRLNRVVSRVSSAL